MSKNVRKKVETYYMGNNTKTTKTQPDDESEYNQKKDNLPSEQKRLVEKFKGYTNFKGVRMT